MVLLDTETPGTNGEIYSEDDEGEILTGNTVVLLDTETPGTNGEIYSEDDEGEILTGNPWITNPKSGN